MMQNASLQDRAANFDTLLAVVIAVRETNLIVRNHSGHDSEGPNRGCNRAFSTVPKSQVGKRFFFGGHILTAALKNCFIKGLSAHLCPVKEDSAETQDPFSRIESHAP